jgi:small redox-active disulfide protein 2
MKSIEVLGPGCSNCKMLYERTRQAVQELGLTCEVVKVTDLKVIVGYRVMSTPALVVDGQVMSAGKVPSVEQIKAILS